jgi:hypothetical protein
MAAVYSARLIYEAGLSSSAAFTCPDGMVMVVRDIDVFVGAELALPSIQATEASDGTFWIAVGTIGEASSFQWQGRQVFPAGSTLVMIAENGTWDVRVSGYLLTAP